MFHTPREIKKAKQARVAAIAIDGTTKKGLFLDYQGLPLLWSWMVDMPPDATNLKALVRTPRVVLKAGILYSKGTWACFNLERYGTIMARQQEYD